MKAAVSSTFSIIVIPLFLTRPVAGGRLFNALHEDIRVVVPDLGSNDSVVMLSAYSDQEWVRLHPEDARKLNVEAVGQLCDLVISTGAHFVFLSSEAVFGKDRQEGWEESAFPCPVTEYGRQKAEAEDLLGKHGNRCIVRTGWNVGWEYADRCIIKATYELLLGGKAQMATDNILTLTNVHDTSRALIEICVRQVQGVIHLVSTTPIVRSRLADFVIASSKFGAAMSYAAVKYADRSFQEYRPRQAWLRVTDVSIPYCGDFDTPQSIVTRKVGILDAIHEDNLYTHN